MSAQPMTSDPSATRELSEYELIDATRRTLALLSGKWSIEVLYLLASGTRRYSQVLYEVGLVSKKTLTQTLRTLERRGLISRQAYAEIPPRVEYSLTPLGWSLTGPLLSLAEWAAEQPQVPHLRAVESPPDPGA
jgi:DNA-binding HxlR family transcriptional regulator